MSARTYTILWLDDEPRFLEDYADAIRADEQLRLEQTEHVGDALAKLEDPGFAPDLLIWDMIIHYGPLDPKETARGLRTGAVFFQRFRARFPSVPAILFTNVEAEACWQFHSPKDRSYSYRKSDMIPFELVKAIKKALGLAPEATKP